MAKNPLERVAQEMSGNCALSEDELIIALHDLMVHLSDRALASVDQKESTQIAHSHQFWSFGELILQFGTALIAFDDIESTDDHIIN